MSYSAECTLDEMFGREVPGASRKDLFTSNLNKDARRYKCFWTDEDAKNQKCPPAFVVADEATAEEMFVEVATFFPAAIPFTAGTHVIHPRMAIASHGKDESRRLPRLVSAWSAVAVAEAITARVSVNAQDRVRYSDVRATLAFVLGRARNLYGDYDTKDVAVRWLKLGAMLGEAGDSPIFGSLTWMFRSIFAPKAPTLKDPLVRAVHSLASGSDAKGGVATELNTYYPGISNSLTRFVGPFDQRIGFFKAAIELVLTAPRGTEVDALAIGFLANEILPGSMSHSGLLLEFLPAYPSVLLWYAVFSALSPEFSLATLQGGVGIKLRRDLMRNFDLFDTPGEDISVDELAVLSRIRLNDDGLRPSWPDSLVVSILPGVSVPIRTATKDSALVESELRTDTVRDVVKQLEDAIAVLRGQARVQNSPRKRKATKPPRNLSAW